MADDSNDFVFSLARAHFGLLPPGLRTALNELSDEIKQRAILTAYRAYAECVLDDEVGSDQMCETRRELIRQLTRLIH